jgi:hypothetical protein
MCLEVGASGRVARGARPSRASPAAGRSSAARRGAARRVAWRGGARLEEAVPRGVPRRRCGRHAVRQAQEGAGGALEQGVPPAAAGSSGAACGASAAWNACGRTPPRPGRCVAEGDSRAGGERTAARTRTRTRPPACCGCPGGGAQTRAAAQAAAARAAARTTAAARLLPRRRRRRPAARAAAPPPPARRRRWAWRRTPRAAPPWQPSPFRRGGVCTIFLVHREH